MTALTERIALDGTLLCPNCRRASWQFDVRAFCCQHCGTKWPVRHRVPDFFNRYRSPLAGDSKGDAEEHPELVMAIVNALALTEQDGMAERVAEIVARASNWTCEESAHTAEINDLKDRFAPSSFSVAQPPPPAPNFQPRFELIRHYLPPSLHPGSVQSVNFRLANRGDAPWSSRIEQGLRLAAKWLDAEGAKIESMNTRFPMDIAAGRAISLPLRIVAPARQGRYRLSLNLQRIDSGESVGEAVVLEVPVKWTADSACMRGRFRWWPRWLASGVRAATRLKATGSRMPVNHDPQIANYAEDHATAAEMIRLSLRQAEIPNARILEVGSGTHPHTAWLAEHDVVALDISSPLLELGSLYFGDRFLDRLSFVCADACNAPFATSRFDLVCMFSALHHFPEPDTVLMRLAELLKPSGQLAVMCEPVGDSLEQPGTLRDLLKGINEQVFSLAEYQLIFATAGLAPRQIRVDGASLKAILVRASGCERA